MFDIGFWELALIGVVALIVIGPEKLPAVARTLGYWIGKGRRFVASVQDDLNREINKAEELKRLLEEQSKIKEMHEIIEHTVDETKKTVSVGAQAHQPKPFPEIEGQPEDRANIAESSSTENTGSTSTTASKTAQTADSVNEQAK
jgi:sec-independent protein translocase protein TatB